MVERENMITFYVKCVFISSKHAIFEVEFYDKKKPFEIIAKANIVVDDSLYYDCHLNTINEYDNEVDNKIKEVGEICVERAEFIFQKNNIILK